MLYMYSGSSCFSRKSKVNERPLLSLQLHSVIRKAIHVLWVVLFLTNKHGEREASLEPPMGAPWVKKPYRGRQWVRRASALGLPNGRIILSSLFQGRQISHFGCGENWGHALISQMPRSSLNVLGAGHLAEGCKGMAKKSSKIPNNQT